MRVFTKFGLVLLAFTLSASVLVAQSFNEHGPKEVKQVNIPQTDDMFDLLFEFPPAVGGGEAGIETDGTYIYTSKWNGTGEFYQYDAAGNLIATLNVPGSNGCRDIAYNGTYFYGGAASTTIFEMDILNETMVSTFTGPTACRAIAYNEDDDVFYCNNWSDDITAFDPSGAFVSSFATGPVGASYYGFAYESSSYCGDGPYLWGNAQTGNTLNELVQMDPIAGVETGVYFDVGTVATVGAGIAGGLAIDDMIVPGFYSIIGTAQNEIIWGLELCSSGPGLDNDLGVQSITAPSTGLNLSNAEAVTILVKNYGNNPQTSFDVSFTLDGGTPVTESVSTTIDPGGEYEHTFGTTVDLSAYGMYDFEACVTLVGDENANNDCKTKMVENIEPSLCLAGLYTSGCGLGDGLTSWEFADVTVDPIGCDGPQFLWYHDYMDQVHNVEPGMSYDLTVTAGYGGEHVYVWVDWNEDLFMDVDELLVEDWILDDGGVTYTMSVTIPADAPIGNYTMRYRTNWLNPIAGSCDILSYGNMADFTISTGQAGPMMVTLSPFMEDYATGSTDGATKTETSLINAIGDVEKGWVKWDISELESKANVTIDSIWMWVYVNETNWPYWRITPLFTDPITGDPGTLFDEVVAGQDDAIAYSVNNESSTFDVGWHGYKLINNANSDLESAIGNGWFGTGIGDTDAGTTYFLIIDGWEETNMPYMEVYYSAGGPTPTARVQAIHNSADAAAEVVDVWLNDILLLDDFTFRTASPFVDAPAGEEFTLAVLPPNSTSPDDPIWSQNYTLAEGETYVLVAEGIVSPSGYTPATAFDIAVYDMGREEATVATNTDVLVHHGSTDAPVVDVYEIGVGAGQIVDDLAYFEFAGYLELGTDDYVLEITDETGTVSVVAYEAPLATLGLDGAALVAVASGFLDPSVNSNGPEFGLWVALPTGGDMIPLPVFSDPCEDFDALSPGDYVALELGDPWDTWSSAPGTAEDALITDAQSASSPNSFVVAQNVDLIYKFGDEPIDMGAWLYSNNMYIPAGQTGYFNIQSEPTPGVAWVCEFYFNGGGAGEATIDGTTTDFTYPEDEWFWAAVNIDLDADLGDFWINDDILVSFPTTNTIGGVDYFGAAATDNAHYDDVCFDEGYPMGGTLEPPQNLEGEVFLSDVELMWDPPAGFSLEEIAYDDGTNEAIFWVGEPSTTDQYLALRLTMPEDGTIQEIAISASSPDGSSFNDVIVAADNGSGAPDLGNTYENFGAVAVPTTTASWITLELTSPFDLTSGEDFWILVNWPDGNLGTNGPFIGADNTVPPTEDRNYWSNTPGVWNLWSDHWWMMRAYYSLPGEKYASDALQVLPADNAEPLKMDPIAAMNPVFPDNIVSNLTSTIMIDGVQALTGYNVYRDGETIAFTEDEMYADLGLDPGMYEYYVTAVYDEGESDPSNSVMLEVEEIVQEECEDFDDLTVGGFVAEQLGGLWTTWSNSPGGADDAIVSDAVSLSAPNSMLIDGTADMLQLLNSENLTSGVYKVSLNIYVPTGTTGYFNLQKDINPGVEWGFQVMFEEDGLQYIDGAGAAAVLWPFDYDTWILCEMYVDLDNDWMMYYVDGELVHEYQWSLGTFGTPGASPFTLAGVNYYANPGLTGTPPGAHFDDICFEDVTPAPCDNFDDLVVGGYVAEQLGGNWTTWSGTPGTAEDALVTDAQAFSTPNSFIVDPNVDLVRTFGNNPLDEGAWLYSHQMYVASGTAGYFNVQSEPTPGVAWVVELFFNVGGAGEAVVDGVTTEFTYPEDEWFWVGVNIDLDMDMGDFWINDEILVSFETTNTIGGIDYFGGTADDAAYYDDVCFEEGYPIVPDPCENFDDLTVGGYVAEQLGDPWDTWSGTPGTSEDALVTDAQSFSAPNSFIVDPNVDLIYKFGDAALTSGAWLYSHMMYVASGTTGYFNVQSDPAPGVAWVVEITFNDGGTGTFVHDGTTQDFTYPQDEWFWVGVNMDVDNGYIDLWFNESIVYSLATTNSIGGIDYFGAAATDAAYYDDVCFEEGYEIVVPPPTDLEVMIAQNGIDIELNWNAPGGDEKSSVMTNQWTGTGSGASVEKDPNAKNNPIFSEEQFDLLFDYGPAGTSEAGIETDGMYIYTSVWNGTGNFLKYDQAGNFVEEFTIAGSAGCRDIAYDGNYFYGGAASTTIFEMDFDGQTMVSTFTGPAAARAIAYNEVDDAFYCNNWSDNITKFDKSGANLGSFPVGPVGASYYGFAFDNYSGGTYLWGYSQAGATQNELVQIELPSGTETGVYFDVGSIIDPAATGIAGGLAIDGMFVPDTWTIIGNMQGISLFGVELASNTGLMGYNVYYSADGGSTFTLAAFTTETTFTHEDPGVGLHCYQVTAVYEFLESEPTDTECEEIVSVEESLATSVQIFPNPASNYVNIKSDFTIDYVTIYNFAGQAVASEQVKNNNYTVNVAEFNPGVYIFQIETTEGRLTERIIIE